MKNIPHGPHPLHPSPFCIEEVQTFGRWGSDTVLKLPYVELNAIEHQKSARKIFAIRKAVIEPDQPANLLETTDPTGDNPVSEWEKHTTTDDFAQCTRAS